MDIITGRAPPSHEPRGGRQGNCQNHAKLGPNQAQVKGYEVGVDGGVLDLLRGEGVVEVRDVGGREPE